MPWAALAAGILFTILVLGLRIGLNEWLGEAPHFLLPFTLPVLVAASWGGVRAGAGTVAFATVLLALQAPTSGAGLDLSSHADQLRLGLFVTIGLFMTGALGQLRRAQHNATKTSEVMRRQLETLQHIASARTEAEARLSQSQARQSALVEALPQLIWTCRDDGWCDFLSPQWIAYTGIPEAEQLGYGWSDAVHVDDRDFVLSAWQLAVQHAATFDVTFRIRRADGAYRWFKTRAVRVEDPTGTGCWFGTNTDIHDLRSAEDALRDLTRTLEQRVEDRTRALQASELRFSAIFHAQFQFIGLMTPDGVLLEANRTALSAAGVAAGDVLGRPFVDTVWWAHDASQRDRLRDAVRRAAKGEQVRFEASHPTASGTQMWVDFSITPFTDMSGRVVLLIPEGRDITARKEAEMALALQEERFRSAFDHAPIGLALVSPEGRWLRVNEALCELVGYREEQLLSTSFQDITHPEDLQADLQLVGDLLANRIPTYQLEKRYVHRDGQHVPVLLSVSLVRDSRGAPLYFISQILDISHQKRAELVMQNALQEKELLLKEIHHRVKNNLQVVSTLLDLQSDFSEDPLTQSMFAESRSRVRSMALIHERLYRSQDLARVPVHDYIAQLAQDLYRSYGVSETEVLFGLDVSIPSLTLDVAIPCGLLINELLSNCFKHAFTDGRPGAITVSFSEESPGQYCLEVCDTGAGFPSPVDPRHATTFGLQLVQTLVEQLRGTLRVTSDPNMTPSTRIAVSFPATAREPLSGIAA